MRIALSSLALALALIGCTDPDVNIVDGGPTPDGPKLDAETTEVDAGIDGTPITDMCSELGPPPEGAYFLGADTHRWICGFSAAPGNQMNIAIEGESWTCDIMVEGTSDTCQVTCPPDHMDHMAYTDLAVYRAGSTLPYRFYYGIAGTPQDQAEFLCFDLNTVPVPSAFKAILPWLRQNTIGEVEQAFAP